MLEPAVARLCEVAIAALIEQPKTQVDFVLQTPSGAFPQIVSLEELLAPPTVPIYWAQPGSLNQMKLRAARFPHCSRRCGRRWSLECIHELSPRLHRPDFAWEQRDRSA